MTKNPKPPKHRHTWSYDHTTTIDGVRYRVERCLCGASRKVKLRF